jgi:hypothetical protein
MNQGNPPPNWYPDPKGEAELRYWDGGQWTEHTHSSQTAAQPAPAAPPPSAAPPPQSAPPVASDATAPGTQPAYQQPAYQQPAQAPPAQGGPAAGSSGGGLGKKLPLIIGAVLAVVAIGVVLALVLGGGDDPPSEADKAKDAAKESITSAETSACTELATQDFLQRATGESGSAAVTSCEANPEALADDVEVGDAEVTGDKAVVTATPKDGDLDGKELELTLVKQDDKWKVDDLVRLDLVEGEAATRAVTTTVFNFGSSEGAKACVYLAYSKLQSFQGGKSGCETEFKEATAANYTADDVNVSDRTATVVVTESKQGRKIQFTLAHEAGQWRIKDFEQQ